MVFIFSPYIRNYYVHFNDSTFPPETSKSTAIVPSACCHEGEAQEEQAYNLYRINRVRSDCEPVCVTVQLNKAEAVMEIDTGLHKYHLSAT